MNNENNLVNQTNNVVSTTPVAPQPVVNPIPQETPVASVTPVTPVASTPTPLTQNVVPTSVAPQPVINPIPQETPVASVTPVTPVASTPTAPQPIATPVESTPQTAQYSTPTININNNERVFRGNTEVIVKDDSKDYNSIEEQLGGSEITDNNSNQPQIASVSVDQVNNEIAKDNILNSITLDEDDNEQSGDAESVTFDYNEIYGNKTEKKEEVKEETTNEVFSAKEINIQDRTRKKVDIAPEFNLNALDGDNTIEKSQDNVLSEKQQDRADTRRKIMFIGIIVLIIIVALEFIFPMFV